MITGFNTDIKHNDKVYHIQTEDKGLANPYIESLVYVGGEILASKKTSYAEQIKTGIDEKWISGLMEQQHRTMIAAIKRGRLDQPADETKFKTPRATVAAPAPGSAKSAGPATDEKTLDQVIIDYLASEAESEHLELSLLNQADFFAGAPVEIKVATRRSLSQNPIPGRLDRSESHLDRRAAARGFPWKDGRRRHSPDPLHDPRVPRGYRRRHHLCTEPDRERRGQATGQEEEVKWRTGAPACPSGPRMVRQARAPVLHAMATFAHNAPHVVRSRFLRSLFWLACMTGTIYLLVSLFLPSSRRLIFGVDKRTGDVRIVGSHVTFLPPHRWYRLSFEKRDGAAQRDGVIRITSKEGVPVTVTYRLRFGVGVTSSPTRGDLSRTVGTPGFARASRRQSRR